MNSSGLKCGLTIVQPYQAPSQNEVNMMWDITVNTNNIGSDKQFISFQFFVMIADLYKTYSNFQQPLDFNYILEKDFDRAITELDVPSRITSTSAREI